MPLTQIEQIIDYIEMVLNLPVIELMLDKQLLKKVNRNPKRRNKIEIKCFFHNVVCQLGFVHLPELDEHLENM